MQIPAWMITEEMKHTEHYQMYAKVFGIDVTLTQSQPTESTQGTHRKPSAPRRSTASYTTPSPVSKCYKQVEDDFTRYITCQIEKMVDGQENVVDDSSIPRNDESNIPGTRIELRSNKESPKVEITKDKDVRLLRDSSMVDITNVVIPVNVNDEDEEITDKVYELKRSEKGKIVEEIRNSPIPTPIIDSPRIN
ncbi:hypothetical protein Tco_1273564 [Tanacetum coccineum]